jgi:hypothetical protein
MNELAECPHPNPLPEYRARGRARKIVQLIVSMPEYQLC